MKLGAMVGQVQPPKRRVPRATDGEPGRTFEVAWAEYSALQDAGNEDAADEIMDEMIHEWPEQLEAKLSGFDALVGQ